MYNKLKEIINHAKLYGFIFKSSEIYNGIKSIYDYGPQGIEMKNNIKKFWWNYMVKYRDNIVGIESSIFMNNKVWKASGHIKNFNELFIINYIDNKIYIIDKLFYKIINYNIIENKKKIKLIFNYYFKNKKIKKLNLFLKQLINKYNLSKKFKWNKINNINLMFKTKFNSLNNDKFTYLRPETAQGIFVNIKNVKNSNRLKIPFGIAQIGKSFRNEIISKQFIFRTREFEQMEMQYFIYPGQEKKWYKYWLKSRLKWHYYLINKKKYKLKIHKNLSHYCKFATDIELKIFNKFKEIEGIHFRKNYDLKNHKKLSKKNLYFYDNKEKKSYIPYVIETSLGLDRLFYSIFTSSFKIEKINNKKRIYLKLPIFISPIKIAIFPIIKKNKIINVSKKIFNFLKYKFTTIYDENKSIGKRYKIQDSLGTPYCITIDFITLKNNTVTIRLRDNMKQIRCKINKLIKYFNKKFDISLFFKNNI
ncbi:glycine--tRNA ligase [Candidatus Shikimatogenerans bostrichidophilus]|uniref:glycine--tRNA ligase n=1 Tax=Candidatus Shikimatogenerans bostrichidophilus TaxID=2943807 RepID=UPI002966029E